MAKYAHVNSDNILQGWYDDTVHDSIPTPKVKVTDTQWQNAINNFHNKVKADGSSEVVDVRSADQKKTDQDKINDAKAGNDKLIELGLSQAQITAMTGYTPPSE